ncbi:MAG: hypothetical protein IKJ83_01135, partial [Ruminococcus sp.]|nr:hypothetical protein [Ruminococcus sp.]
MKKKIFFSIFITCLSVIFFCTFIIAGFLYNYYTNQQNESLKTQLNYLVHMSEEHDIEHLQNLPIEQKIIILDQNKRLVLENSGTLLIPEEALSEVFAESRASVQGHHISTQSFSKKLVVHSVLINDNSVICIADTQHTYVSLLGHISGYVGVILLAAALVSILLARFLSNKILKPVYDMNLSSPDKRGVYPELLPFIDKITEQNKEINRRMSDIESHHEAQDRMRREFTANVSHELKTPLTSISGYAELIRDGLVKEEDIPRFAGKIYDESKRMINLVGDIIKLSQLDEKDISVTIERIDLYECCQAVIQSLEPLAAKRGITFTLEGDHCYINGAEIIIEEIVLNICDNAVKYNKENGSITVSIRQCIDGVELSVSDTGIGIAKEDLDHVFERFYRADKSHSKEIGGTGLGLSIVKHGAMFHNAYVSLDSETGIGTTVRILF